MKAPVPNIIACLSSWWRLSASIDNQERPIGFKPTESLWHVCSVG
jgi:hypothetical protein